MHKWADRAVEIFPSAKGNHPVRQLQVVHESRPSVTHGFLAALREYLRELGLDSFEDLEQQNDLRVVVEGAECQDPDGVGLEAWRVALFFAALTSEDALDFLSSFLLHIGGLGGGGGA